MATEIRAGTILIPRPLHELGYCFTHVELPSLQLLVRLVKTCAKAIFRWHFYEIDSVAVKNATYGFIEAFDGKVVSVYDKRSIYTCGVKFVPPVDIKFEFTPLETISPFSLENILTHFRRDLDIKHFDKCYTFTDLWNNQNFQRV